MAFQTQKLQHNTTGYCSYGNHSSVVKLIKPLPLLVIQVDKVVARAFVHMDMEAPSPAGWPPAFRIH